MGLKEELLSGEKRVGVWGTGFIGFTTIANMAYNGIKTIGLDVVKEKVDSINRGENPIENLEYWLGFDIKNLTERGMLRATTDWKDMLKPDIAVHFVCIPTEKGGEPYDDILVDVVKKIVSLKDVKRERPPLVIVESTLTPGRSDEIVLPMLKEAGINVGKDILYGVAPRRDWFVSPEKSLKKLPRVFGGTTHETTELMREALSVVCENLVPAPDHKHAEMVKSIENAYRHMEIALANQLSLAYPNVDMTEVLRLVGTKWNIGTYHPSFGTGGYCLSEDEYVFLEVDGSLKCMRIADAVKGSGSLKGRRVRTLSFDTDSGKPEYKDVTALSKRAYSGDIIEIVTKYNRRIKVTIDHPMIISRNNEIITEAAGEIKDDDELVLITSLPAQKGRLKIDIINTLTPELKKRARVSPTEKRFDSYKDILAGHLKKYHKCYYDVFRNNSMRLDLYLKLEKGGLMPIKRNEISLYTGCGKVNRIPAVFNVDEEFAEFVGYYLSEGCLTKDKSWRIYFSFNKKERPLIEFVTGYMDKLGISHIEYEDKKFETCHIRASSFILSHLFKNVLDCGTNSYCMNIPSLFFKAPEEIRFSLLKGLLSGDGSVSRDKAIIEYYTISEKMSQQVILMLQSLGITPAIKNNHNGKGDLIRVHGSERLNKLKDIFRGDKAVLLNRNLEKNQCYAFHKTEMEVLDFVEENYPATPFQVTQNLGIGYDTAISAMTRFESRGLLTSERTQRTNEGLRFFSPTDHQGTYDTLPIKHIKRKKADTTVYSIEVKDTHTFVTSYGLVVHNCIPLSSQYVLLGAKHPEKITILKETIDSDREQPEVVAESMKKRGFKNIGILGLAYKGDIKVDILSPTIKIAKKLKALGLKVKVNDPYYTKDEITRITGTESFDFPEGLDEFDAVLIVADHQHYKFTPHNSILKSLKNCKLILDNTEIWKDINFKTMGIEYHISGDAGWIEI